MKTIALLILSVSMLLSASKSHASIISTTETLVLDFSNPTLFDQNVPGQIFRLFSSNLGALAPNFDPNGIFANPLTQIRLAPESTRVFNSVSETANSNGTTTRETLEISETIQRTITDVSILTLLDLLGFLNSDLTFAPNSIFLDFSNTQVVDTSRLALSITFDQEVTNSEVLSSSFETFLTNADAGTDNNASEVSAPSLFLLSLLAVPALLVRRRKV